MQTLFFFNHIDLIILHISLACVQLNLFTERNNKKNQEMRTNASKTEAIEGGENNKHLKERKNMLVFLSPGPRG